MFQAEACLVPLFCGYSSHLHRGRLAAVALPGLSGKQRQREAQGDRAVRRNATADNFDGARQSRTAEVGSARGTKCDAGPLFRVVASAAFPRRVASLSSATPPREIFGQEGRERRSHVSALTTVNNLRAAEVSVSCASSLDELRKSEAG